MSDKKMTVELTKSEMISISVALSYYENELNDGTRKRLKEIEEHKSDKGVKLAQDLLLYAQKIRIRNIDIDKKLTDAMTHDFDEDCKVSDTEKTEEWDKYDTVFYPGLMVNCIREKGVEAADYYFQYEPYGKYYVNAGIGFRTPEEAIVVAQKWLDEAKQNKQSK